MTGSHEWKGALTQMTLDRMTTNSMIMSGLMQTIYLVALFVIGITMLMSWMRWFWKLVSEKR